MKSPGHKFYDLYAVAQLVRNDCTVYPWEELTQEDRDSYDQAAQQFMVAVYSNTP